MSHSCPTHPHLLLTRFSASSRPPHPQPPQVWLARYCQTTVAVKLLNQTKVPGATDSAAERSVLRQLQKEAGLMSLMRHPNVVSYFGACLDPPCLIMEFASKKSVDCVLSQVGGGHGHVWGLDGGAGGERGGGGARVLGGVCGAWDNRSQIQAEESKNTLWPRLRRRVGGLCL